MSISSPPVAVLVTLAPLANFFPNTLAASPSLTPKCSSPATVVTHFFLLRTARVMSTSCATFFFALPDCFFSATLVCASFRDSSAVLPVAAVRCCC